MKSIKNILMAITLLLSVAFANAQIKNKTTEKVKIYGNCDMCKTKIEAAGSINKVAKVQWDKDTKIATLTYDNSKTSQDEILKKIALAGYDSDAFRAPDAIYESLHGCCQYDRELKVEGATGMKTESNDIGKHSSNTENIGLNELTNGSLNVVFDRYFVLKEGLVQSHGQITSNIANEFATALGAVKMDDLAMDVHMVWMKEMKTLMAAAKNMAATTDVNKQRVDFIPVSKSVYELIKVAKYETPVYLQFCPMANDGVGANWLSKEQAIKNPYYGSQMMTCGKLIETIQ